MFQKVPALIIGCLLSSDPRRDNTVLAAAVSQRERKFLLAPARLREEA